MTLITAENTASQTDSLLDSIVSSIQDLRQELEDLRRKVREGEELDKTQSSKTVVSATALLRTCQDVENRLVECRTKSAGIAQGGYALDLDRARADIGCKLDRLRCTASAGRLPE